MNARSVRLALELLLAALLCLGATPTTSKSMGFATTTDTPTVTGDILNPAYFAHAAYVTQGVSDRAKVFSLPLRGVPELDFLPTASGIEPASVIWSVEISHPEGIGAEIAGGTLFIWGNNAAWAGYGAVTLTAASGNASGSVTIPATVFRSDKTLVNSEGKKDYFVPWSPQLDINRILSVEEHMRKYNKDQGNLDRSAQWSRWKRMAPLRDVEIIKWANAEATAGRWTRLSQFALVDVLLGELQRLGVQTIRVPDALYLPTVSGSEIRPVYDHWNSGPSRTAEETTYVVDEAHRLGMAVMLSNWIGVDAGATGVAMESWQASPTDPNAFWDNYERVTLAAIKQWTSLGADIVSIGNAVEYIGPNTASSRSLTNDRLMELAAASRALYPGPLGYIGGGPWPGNFPPWSSLLGAPFWASVDIVSVGISLNQLDPLSPSLATDARILTRWHDWIDEYFGPFQQRLNKPFVANENGCGPVEGALVWGAYYRIPENPVIDLSQMARYYILQNEAFRDMNGYYGPGWFAFAFDPGLPGGVRDPDWNARLKVEDVIREVFDGPPDTETIHIDGSVDDWPAAALLARDPRGDVGGSGRDDLLALHGAESDFYYYIRLDYAQPPTGYLAIGLDTDADGSPEVAIVCNNRWTPNHRWTASLETPAYNPSDWIGVGDIVDAGPSLEMRIAKRYLPSVRGRIAICSVQDYDEANGNVWAIVSDEMHGVFEIPRLP